MRIQNVLTNKAIMNRFGFDLVYESTYTFYLEI